MFRMYKYKNADVKRYAFIYILRYFRSQIVKRVNSFQDVIFTLIEFDKFISFMLFLLQCARENSRASLGLKKGLRVGNK